VTPAPAPVERPRLYRTLGELRADPDLLRPPEAVIPYLAFRQRVTMLAALEKMGKTTFGCYAAAHKTTGAAFLGEPIAPGTVLWLALEGHVGDVVRTLVEAGADDDRLLVVSQRLPEKLETITSLVRETRPAVVFMDTLASATQGLVKEAHEATEWTPIMNRLGEIARDGDTAIVINHHARKSDGEYRDSTAIGAGVDMILTMSRAGPDQPSTRKIRAIGRFPLNDYAVRFEDGGYSLVSATDSPLELKVLDFIRRNEGVGTTKLREGVGGRASAIDDALGKLLQQGLVVDAGDDKGHRYRLPSPVPHPPGRTGVGTGGAVPPNSLWANGRTGLGTGGCPESETLGGGTGQGSDAPRPKRSDEAADGDVPSGEAL
jgi:hypothetical protein